MTAAITGCRTGRSLINDDLFDRLVDRIVHDEDMTRHLAVRIMDQALAFLAACATDHDNPLAPSPLVDIGWHTFLLHTRAYAEFCRDIAGRFLHHEPTEPKALDRSEAAEVRLRTLTAIEAADFVVDTDLWAHAADVDCTGCHNGCHNDPPPAHR